MGLTNCLEELKGNGIELENILALYISVNYGEHNEKYREIKYAKYSKYNTISLKKLEKILSEINYKNTWGKSSLNGKILMKDNSFYDRYDYGGYQRWKCYSLPSIDDILNYN